ncbi:uncharacterized protein FIBRA_01771 [Fibroporia radiculosa]|uniref:Cation/H+ exchanger transmembrane domain-containing protein n=1 Tax=Fibroporia radiculosa TaxID=599839 RepID=J4H1F0_9APHY|nr:uncharacterized protein FIBRA_01771 [Fibroporia radiculosa]CCL99749.1 predicted protein [Fibroporia radiculosa]
MLLARYASLLCLFVKPSLDHRHFEKGGLLTGQDPSDFNTSDPLRLWVIQLGVILMMTQVLSLVLGKIKQPKVIAEVIGGILLGPTAFGRIPGFTEHVFPEQSLPYLSLVANIGLCLFLFLVGLEIDGAIVKRNFRLSFIIAVAGMALPFGLGAALSVPLYHTFIPSTVKFTNFMLFTGVAYSITAFPVLCRILTELKLLDTTVGIVVLSAGVGNDVVGWVLLALSVALVNAGSGLTALWILFVCLGWALFLLIIMTRVMYWLARKTGSIENGPTVFFMTITILLMFGSAFFTDVIGVQAIFGAFLAGLAVPREGGLCITLTEKLEDMVSIIFLPLYFTISGLNTNLGLLNNGITWGFTIAICTLSYSGKFGGCAIAARLAGFSWREASTIGSLMSCKGLVELIVLNVGLSAGILSQRVFSMFVLEALILTFMTTPAVVVLYPPEMRVRVSLDNNGATGTVKHRGDEHTAEKRSEASSLGGNLNEEAREHKSRFTIVLDKIEHLPALIAFTQLIQPPAMGALSEGENTNLSLSTLPGSGKINRSKMHRYSPNAHEVSVNALRLIELSDRASAVMRSSNADSLIHADPLLNIFSTFGSLNGISVSSSLAIVAYDDLALSIAENAQRHRSQLVLLPWLPFQPSLEASPSPDALTGDARDLSPTTPRATTGYMQNPFETLFRTAPSGPDQSSSAVYSTFVRSVFARMRTDVALFVDRRHLGEAGLPIVSSQQHIFMPFFGGPDDRLALDFVVQLCAHPRTTATVLRIRQYQPHEAESIDKPAAAHLVDKHPIEVTMTAFPDTIYDHHSTQTRLQSETADNVLWSRYVSQEPGVDAQLLDALSRIEFSEVQTPTPLRTVVEYASNFSLSASEIRCRSLIMVGRSRRLAFEYHQQELKQLMEHHGAVGSEIRKTMGDVASALLVTGSKASIAVFQAADTSLD